MRILFVATKSPYPPQDGGRLVVAWTVRGLIDAGHEVVIVHPGDAVASAVDTRCVAVRCAPRRAWTDLGQALRRGHAVTVQRHHHPDLSATVARLLAADHYDVVHAEQLQAWANVAEAAQAAGVPALLRMQNVESDLWRQVAAARWWAMPLQYEARRVARDERAAMQRAAAVVSLTNTDADLLRGQVPDRHVHAIAPPVPPCLHAAAPLPGDPAIALVGSAGWWPNRDALSDFLARIWPASSRTLPQARLHVFGGRVTARPDLVAHAAPEEAIDAFPAEAIAAVPLRIGSGIRMRILEAFARGVPVIASTVAARGLAVRDGVELRIADDADGFIAACRDLRDPTCRAGQIAAARRHLVAHHDPRRQTEALLDRYRSLIQPG